MQKSIIGTKNKNKVVLVTSAAIFIFQDGRRKNKIVEN
jgi:hypothetical protein